MATKLASYFVKVFLKRRDFITLNFGNFVIVLGYSGKKSDKDVSVFCRENCESGLLFCCGMRKIGAEPRLVEISHESFENIEKVCLKLESSWGRNSFNLGELHKLLGENFSQEMKLFSTSPS